MNILILDAYSAAHVGNGVLYQSSVYYLKKIFPESTINVLCFRKDSIEKIKLSDVNKHGKVFIDEPPVGKGIINKASWMAKTGVFLGVHWLNLKTLKIQPSKLSMNLEVKEALKLLEDSDIAVSITGEQINDAFRKTLPQFMFIHNLAIQMNKKMIYFPQSIGPLNKKWTQKMVKSILSKSFLTIARDEFSVKELEKIGLNKSKYIFTPDIGVIQPYADRQEANKILEDNNIIKTKKLIVGLTLSKVHFVEDGLIKKDYLKVLKDSIYKTLNSEDVQFLLMPANYNLDGSNATDYNICEMFKEELKKDFTIDILPFKIYSPYDFKGMQGCMDFIISTRMHASILSTMAETPTITINTQRKLKGYMKNINMEYLSIDLVDLNEEILSQKINLVIKNNSEIRNILKDAKKDVINKLTKIENFTKEV